MRALISLILILVGTSGEAARRRHVTFHSELAFQYSFVSNLADKVAGGTYSRKYSSGVAGRAHLGVSNFLISNWYIGALYDHWVAGRTMIINEGSQKDFLRYQSIGVESGFFWNVNPRLFWFFSGGVLYPLKMEVVAGPDIYTATKTLGYFGRVCLGLQLETFLSLLLEGGYRVASLGALISGSTPFLSGTNDFNLSGIFASVGLMVSI